MKISKLEIKMTALILVVLFAASMAASISIPLVKAVDDLAFNTNDSDHYFYHDEEILVGSSMHISGLFFGATLHEVLVREVRWGDTGNGYTIYEGSGAVPVKDEDYVLWGWKDEWFGTNFLETLDLQNLQWGDFEYEPPSAWLGVHWIVNYRVDFYMDSTLIASTDPYSNMHDCYGIGCNEVNEYPSGYPSYGGLYSYGGTGVYNPGDACSVEDDNICGLYAYEEGATSWVTTMITGSFGPAGNGYNDIYAPNKFSIGVFGYTWGGYEPDRVEILAGPSPTEQSLIGTLYPTEIGRTWYPLGNLTPTGYYIYVTIIMYTGPYQYSGGCFQVDAVKLMPYPYTDLPNP